MNISKRLEKIGFVAIAAGIVFLGSSAFSSAAASTVVLSDADHVCRFEERPVTLRYSDSSGGTYEHRTYETVRVCRHEPVVVVEHRTIAPVRRHTTISIGVGYGYGSPAFVSGHHYGHHYKRHHGHHQNRHGRSHGHGHRR